MMTMQELRSSSKKELLLELAKARKERLKVRISLKTKHDKDTSKAKKAKVYIAQLLTALNEAEKEGVAKAPAAVKSEPKAEKPKKAKATTAKKNS